jgi:hypothetical protein
MATTISAIILPEGFTAERINNMLEQQTRRLSSARKYHKTDKGKASMARSQKLYKTRKKYQKYFNCTYDHAKEMITKENYLTFIFSYVTV